MRLLLGVLALGLLIAIGLGAISISRSLAHAVDLERWGADPKNPPDLDDFETAKSQLSVPADLSDEEIEAMVERLFVAEDWRWNHLKLSLVGERAVPMLVDALSDPRIETTEFPLRLHHSGMTSLHRVTLLLDPYGPPEAAEALTRLANHQTDWVRSRAGDSLGNIGTPECIQPVTALLADPEIVIRLMTVCGIALGVSSGRATPEFLEGVFPAVAAIPESIGNREKGFEHELAQESTVLALEIDPNQATEKLLPFLIRSSSEPFVWRALETIDTREIILPHSLVLPLIDEVKKKFADGLVPAETYQALLRTYARNPDAGAEVRLRKELESSDYWVADAAANSLMRMQGIQDPSEFVLELSWSEDGDKLTQPQKTYLRALNYDAEIQNGGHTQFFANKAPKECRETLAALQEIGAMQAAKILEKAISAVGLPSSDQVDPIAPDDDPKMVEKLEEYDDQYYDTDEVTRLMQRYVLEHPEHFKPSDNQ